jgi:hypothetical protein
MDVPVMKPIERIKEKFVAHALLLVGFLLLAGCGGGSGGGTSANPMPPGSGGPSGFVYRGPSPQFQDVQNFQTAFYLNVVPHCGNCHTRGGQGSTPFADINDVNVAYQAALTVVNLQNAPVSEVVSRVESNHNCWEASPAACRVQMISFIQNWANASGGNAATSVKLVAPNDRDPNGGGSGFTDFPSLGVYQASQLYQFVSDPRYCARCHSDTSLKQQPHFGSSVPQISYEAIKSKIDLNDPSLQPGATLKAKSRLVVRLRDEFHNCWTASCSADADAMQGYIRDLQQQSPHITLDSGIYRSKAQILNDGVVGTSGGRFETYQIALWRFLEGEGKVVSDTSGVAPAISLTIDGTEGENGNFKWIGGGGIQFLSPDPITKLSAVAYGSAAASKKLFDLLAPGGEYSIEAWALPTNTADNNREIVAYSDGTDKRNFMLGQTMYNYDFYNRSSDTNSRGMVGTAKFSSNPDVEALQSALQHVVVNYSPIGGRKVYVDGVLVSENYPDDNGTLADDWANNYSVVMGGTLSKAEATSWKGALRMVAIHKRTLSPTQIAQNLGVPPGEKRYVMFNVSHLNNMPMSCRGTDGSGNAVSYCYIYFEMSQYDNYAYLFNKPYFISLNSDISDLNGLRIKGIHLGVNGKLSAVGQAFVHVNATITANSYVPGNEPGSGQLLKNVGTIVPKVSGAEGDLFYLEFDLIGNNGDQTPAPMVLPFGYALNGAAAIDIGWRTFDEINATYSQLTGVLLSDSLPNADSSATLKVSDVFNNVRSQLPAVEDYQAYVASHQTAATQLALAYCKALMSNDSRRQSFFPTNNSFVSFRSDWSNNLINPMVNKFMGGVDVLGAPTRAQIQNELFNLITNTNPARTPGMCPPGCDNAKTLNAATAACAAALANAALLQQ